MEKIDTEECERLDKLLKEIYKTFADMKILDNKNYDNVDFIKVLPSFVMLACKDSGMPLRVFDEMLRFMHRIYKEEAESIKE